MATGIIGISGMTKAGYLLSIGLHDDVTGRYRNPPERQVNQTPGFPADMVENPYRPGHPCNGVMYSGSFAANCGTPPPRRPIKRPRFPRFFR